MRILIVDDNPTNVIIIREILKRKTIRILYLHLQPWKCWNIWGLAIARELHPKRADIDLILLDMMMPEMDGIEACRIVRQYEHLKDIPIIMVTAVGDSKKLAEALDAGAVDYVTKPINKVELMARIRLAPG